MRVPVSPITAGSVSPAWVRGRIRWVSISNSRRRDSSLLTLLSIQKKRARQAPRVAGSSLCTRVPG